MKRLIAGLFAGMMIGSAATAFAATPETVQAMFQKLKIVIDGKEANLANTPLVLKGRTYLPAAELASLVGYDVTYQAGTKTISLQKSVVSREQIQEYAIQESFSLGQTELKLNSVSYASNYKGGSPLNTDMYYAIIDFDVLAKTEPENSFYWSPMSFVNNVGVNGKTLYSFSSYGDVKPWEITTAQVLVEIPKDQQLTEITFSSGYSRDYAKVKTKPSFVHGNINPWVLEDGSSLLESGHTEFYDAIDPN